MERPELRSTTRAIALACLMAVSAFAGCSGDDEGFAEEPRPPVPINVTAAITEDEVTVSPPAFGAGPINLIVSNQSGDTRDLRLVTTTIGGQGPGIEQEVDGISAGDTATIRVDIPRGEYRLETETAGIDPATLTVGEPRPSGQDQLLLP